jgi:hypothetical protein
MRNLAEKLQLFAHVMTLINFDEEEAARYSPSYNAHCKLKSW